jgi:hypothetical protein
MLGRFWEQGAIFIHYVSVSKGPHRAMDPPSALLTLFICHFAKHNHAVRKGLYWLSSSL